MEDYIKKLSSFIFMLNEKNIPNNTLDTTRTYIADYYASAIAGYKINRQFNDAMLEIVKGASNRKEAAVMFLDEKLSLEQAAFMNAIYAHGADMDDGNKKSMGHIAAHTISAVFALAETLDVSWADVFIAINVGYEVFNRIGAAAQPGLAHRGFHSTGVVGGMASAAACAKLMGLDKNGIYSAISIAAVQSSGLFIITESGQECKPLNPANAAKIGIISAKLAKQGVKGPSGVLENPKGWFHAFTDKVNEEMVLDGLGEVFTIEESYLKPYPSCRHTHSVIECAENIRNQLIEQYSNEYIDKIKEIKVYIYPNAVRVAGQILTPQNNEDAKFSIHYSLATALLKGGFTLTDLDIKTALPQTFKIIDNIEIIIDENLENVKMGIRGAKVEVLTDDRKLYFHKVDYPKGEGANPFSQEDLIHKMRGCAEGLLTIEQQNRLLMAIKNIDISKKYSPIHIG